MFLPEGILNEVNMQHYQRRLLPWPGILTFSCMLWTPLPEYH